MTKRRQPRLRGGGVIVIASVFLVLDLNRSDRDTLVRPEMASHDHAEKQKQDRTCKTARH